MNIQKKITIISLVAIWFVVNTAAIALAMQTSQRGIDLIKKWEGFSSEVYICPAGKETIGYGHLVKGGENFDYITRGHAESILREDVGFAENAVNRLVKVELTQGQFDALVSFVYNLGEGQFKSSTLLKKINASDDSAIMEFGRWVFAGGKKLKGLVKRRAEEAMLFGGE